jgi:predicted ATPase
LADHGAAGLIFQGWVRAIGGDSAAGLTLLEEGFARQREVCTNEDFPVYLCLLTEVLTAMGKPDLAVERILRELPDFEACQLRIWMPELLRVLGEAMLAADPGSVEEARRRFEQARTLAEAQQVPMLQLRIASSEARLLQRLDATDEAAMRLDSALALVREDDGSWDLTDARKLRDGLVR